MTHPVSNYRFPPEELAVWREAARRDGFPSLTAWLRACANQCANYSMRKEVTK